MEKAVSFCLQVKMLNMTVIQYYKQMQRQSLPAFLFITLQEIPLIIYKSKLSSFENSESLSVEGMKVSLYY